MTPISPSKMHEMLGYAALRARRMCSLTRTVVGRDEHAVYLELLSEVVHSHYHGQALADQAQQRVDARATLFLKPRDTLESKGP